MKSRGSCSLCVCLFSVFWRKKKKKFFFVAVEKLKKKGERDFYAKTPLEQKSIKRTRAFFFSLESENKSLLRSAARWCDDENDE